MGRRIRVVFASDDRPDYVGGVNSWLKRLFAGLEKRGIECLAYFVADPGPSATARELRSNGFRCRVLKEQDTESRVLRIVEFLRRDRPDVFVANHVVSAVFAARWAKEAGIPTVAAFHTDENFYEALMDLCLGGNPEYGVSAAVCVSRFIEEEARRRSRGPVRIERIPYGVEPGPPVSGRGESPFRIVYSGRLVEQQKRIGRVVSSFCRAVSEVSGTEAVIYGAGPESARIAQRLQAYGQGFPVRLGGRIESERINEVLSEAHAIALLSEYEGLPVALLEAMAAGVVPVCLRIRSGIDELVEDGVTGLVVSDPYRGFVEAIRRLKNDPVLRERLSAAARVRAAQFDQRFCEERWEGLLRSLALERKNSRLPVIRGRLELPPADFRHFKDLRRGRAPYIGRGRGRLRVCMAFPNGKDGMETFVQAHLRGVPADVVGVWGKGVPLNVGSGNRTLIRHSLPMTVARWAVLRAAGPSSLWPYSDIFARFLKRERIDVAFADFGTTGSFIADACAKAKVPLVVHFHGFDAYHRPTVAQQSALYRRLFEYGSAFVVPSVHMQERLARLGAPAGRIRRIYCGVDRHAFRGAAPADTKPHFLAIGRFVEKKAPMLTLAAFKKVKAAVPEATLTMAGEGPLLAACMHLAEGWAIADSVSFTGRMPHGEVSGLLKTARAFVQHSVTALDGDSEATPVSVLEALSSGVPAVTTRHCGLVEAVRDGENGFLVDERDVNGMAEAMIRLGSDAALAGEMGRRAAENFPSRFEAGETLAALHAVLEEAARSGRAGR